ncbi:hypothetical protein BIU82_00175 [Arthrobacter sp. SW1]|nr:hypothetical protein BIU82_00175 [Arthrobacter sp. SW1]
MFSDGAYLRPLRFGILIVAVLAGIVLGPLGGADTALAVTSASGKSLEWQVQSNWYRQAVSQCISTKSTAITISQTDLAAGKWFPDPPVVAIYPGDTGDAPAGFLMRDTLGGIGDDGRIDCWEGGNELTQKALQFWGISGFELACDSGMVKRQNDTDCRQGNGNLAWQKDMGARAVSFRNYIRDKVYGGQEPQLSDAMQFVLYKQTLLKGCAYGAQPLTTRPTGANVYEIAKFTTTPATEPGKSPMVTASSEFYIGDKGSDVSRWLWTNPNNERSCGQLADATKQGSAYANAYRGFIQKNGGEPADQESIPGCEDDTSAACSPSDSSNCTIPQLGWILCPALTIGASLADSAYGFLASNFLEFRSSLVNTSPAATDGSGKKIGTGTYDAWRVMRDFANVGLVIGFILIIFSQLTGVGISNYGIKKMLPRIVAAAILVNISFFICQVAVDLSNIIGVSLKEFMEGVAARINGASGTAITSQNDSNLAGIVLTVIAAGTLVWINIGALMVAITGAVVILAVIFILLALRQVIIVLLIVISPLAFVAFLLPNTQSWFEKWRKTLTALLLLFPVIGLVYGSGLLAHTILRQASGDDTIMRIFAYIALVAPLLATITLLRGSLNAVGAIGNNINKLGGAAQSAAGKATEKRYDNSKLGQYKKFREGEAAKRRALIRAGVYQGRGGRWNPRNWASSANSMVNSASGKFGMRMEAAGVNLSDKAEQEDIDMATKALERSAVASPEATAHVSGAFVQALRIGDSVQARAAYATLLNQGAGGIEAARVALAANPNSGAAQALRNYILTKHGDVKKRDNRMMDWASTGNAAALSGAGHLAGLTDAEIASQTPDSIDAGLLDASRAQRILDDPQIQKDIKPSQRAALQRKTAGVQVPDQPIWDAAGGEGFQPWWPSGETPSGQPARSAAAPQPPRSESPSQRVAREAVEKANRERGDDVAWSRWHEQEAGGSTTDQQGRQTPGGTTDD